MSGDVLYIGRSAALVLLVVAAALFDLRTRRIPNQVNLAGLGVGLVLATAGGWPLLLDSLLGAGLGLIAGLAVFALGVLGGGDAKLVAAVGAFLGPAWLLRALPLMGLLGGLLAIGYAVRKGIILPALFTAGRMIKYRLTFGRAYDEAPRPVSQAVGSVPYGVAIGAGALIWWFTGGTLW